MKNFKKLIAMLAATALLATSVPVFAQETETAPAASDETTQAAEQETYDIPEKVEIIFKVGDDILLINGEEVKVEAAPYVVGTGTTLVPVRVITEAFGAKVGWDGEARKVTLNYPDVNIVLTIDNIVAEVNGEAVTLLAAPEIQNGRTMIPLRFISENFGADVGYDEETKGISVIKETAPDGDIVEGVVDTKYIGDSYYGWTMNNPKDLTMTQRSFDGFKTEFEDENGNGILIKASSKEKDFDAEEFFKDEKEYYSSYTTLIKAEKKEVNENLTTMLFNARTTDNYTYFAVYVTDKNLYSVEFVTENKDEVKAAFLELAQSFKLEFSETDTHDLSNLEDGMRKFESEEMNFSLKLPANITGGASAGKINVFSFSSNNDKRFNFNLEIFSKSEAFLAPVGYVEEDIDSSYKYMNTDIMKIGELQKKTYNNIEAYEYDVTVSGSKTGDIIGKLLSFELGEYVYIINIVIDAEFDTPPEETMSSIINNMEFKEIDPEKVGIIMDTTDADADKSDKEIKIGNITFKTPYSYEQPYTGATAFMDKKGVSFIVMSQTMPFGATVSLFAESLKTSLTNIELEEGEKLETTNPKKEILASKTFYKFNVVVTGEDKYDYSEVYIHEDKGMIYVVLVDIHEYVKSEATLKEVKSIISSFKKTN